MRPKRCLAAITMVALAGTIAGCGRSGGGATAGSSSPSAGLTQSTSSKPLADAVAMVQTFSRDLARAALPEAHWTDHLPDSSDDRGGATDTCVDSAGRDTAYRLVPFTLTADVDTTDATNGDAVLKRAYDYLVAQGFDAGRSTPVLTAGRVAGERDGYIISLDLRTDWHQAVIEGLTPCVH